MTPDSSLAQTLAPELLYKIFTECVPSILSPTVLSTAPLNVSLVCRSWQALALERLDLWATIRLSYADLNHWCDAYPWSPSLIVSVALRYVEILAGSIWGRTAGHRARDAR